MRTPISASMRFRVLAKSGFACSYCGAKAPGAELHLDHIIPLVGGGTNAESNLTAACADCNLGKGSLDMKSGRQVQRNIVADEDIASAYSRLLTPGLTSWVAEAHSLGIRIGTLRRRVLKLGLTPPSSYNSDTEVLEAYKRVKSGESLWELESINLGVNTHSLKVRIKSLGLNPRAPRDLVIPGVREALVRASTPLINAGESPSSVAASFGFNVATFKNIRRSKGLTLSNVESGRRAGIAASKLASSRRTA